MNSIIWARVAATVFFFVFAIFLFAQMNTIHLYHDDWGLSVLSYVSQETGFEGQDFSQFQLVRFLYNHFLLWGGRVTSLFLFIDLSKVGIEYLRLFQVLLILLVTWLSARLVVKGEGFPLALSVAVLCYLALPPFALVGGIYWFTAAAVYLWAIPLILVSILVMTPASVIPWIAVICLSISASFNEVFGISALAVALVWLLIVYVREGEATRIRANLLRMLPILISAGVFLLAPGNFVRLSRTPGPEVSYLANVWKNLGSLSGFDYGDAFLALFAAAFLISLWRLFSGMERRRALIGMFALLAAAVLVRLFFEPLEFAFLVLSFFGVQVLLALRDPGAMPGALAFAAGIGSFLLVLPMGVFAGRSLIPFLILCAPSFVYFICTALPPAARWVRLAALAGVFWLSLPGLELVYDGYRANDMTNRVNAYKLTAAGFEYEKTGEAPAEIQLYRLPIPGFAERMPYDRPLVGQWVKQFYRLPPSVTLIWN